MGSRFMWQSGGRLTGAEDEGKGLRKWWSGPGERIGGPRSQSISLCLSLCPGQSLSTC